MPYHDPDATDPMTLHGVAVATNGEEALVEMTRCFIEEYARLEFGADRILRLFRNPGYVGPALALRALGAERVREMIADELALRGPRGKQEKLETGNSEGISLPVLNGGW